MKKSLLTIITKLGFTSVDEFKKYVKGKAKLNEYGAVCYEEKKTVDGSVVTIGYSNNCKNKYSIGFAFNGMYVDERF